MIFLVEGLLPESYFANNLRGLSVDLAVFRDLMKMRLPALSKHLDHLQYSNSEGIACYEPPLVNVFTLQWFLTLFSNCLPKNLVLRIWDLIFLEGNEILIRSALAIWEYLTDKILSLKRCEILIIDKCFSSTCSLSKKFSADEFYSIMGVLMRELMEFGITDTNELVHNIVNMASFPFPKLAELREQYTYNIRPLSSASSSSPHANHHSSHPFSFVRRGLSLFASSDEEDNSASADDMDFFYEDQIMATHWNLNTTIAITKESHKRSNSPSSPSFSSSCRGELVSKSLIPLNNSTESPDRNSLDVSLLKKQYARLRERQKQAHLILTEGLRYGYQSAFSRSSPVSACTRDRIPIDHLLIGKPALTSSKSKPRSPVLVMKSSSSSSVSSGPIFLKDASFKSKQSNNKVLVRNKKNVNDDDDDQDSRKQGASGMSRQTSLEEAGNSGAKSQIRVKRRLGAGVRRASSILEQASIPDEDDEDAKEQENTLLGRDQEKEKGICTFNSNL